MEFKYLKIDKEEYSRLDEIEYKKPWEKKEIIHFLANFTFKIYENGSLGYKISIDEDIEILYFEILSFIKNTDYNVPKTSSEKKHSEKLIKFGETYKNENITKFSEDDIKRIDVKIFTELNKPLYRVLEFRQISRDGLIFNKKSIGYEVYLEFKRKILNKQKTQTKLSNSQKIKIKGSLQSIGFLFSELIDKGFIEAPKRNGKNNTSAISRMILDHFEFIDREEQPKSEDIRKTLFTENKLSVDKQTLFKIPERNIINTD